MRAITLVSSGIVLGMQLIHGSPPTGTLSGRVETRAIPPRQVASRYPSPGGPVQRSIEPIPTVVFIDGPVAGAPAWPKPARTVLVQKGLQFNPSLLVVPKDTSVSFPNEDKELHNVFSYSKSKRFDLGRYPRGESKTVVFDKLGIVKIYCEVHPWMRAAVLVLENPFFAIVSEDGSFTIADIPAGHYGLQVWNIDAGSRRVEVDIPAGKAPELLIQLSGGFMSEPMERVMHLDAPAARTPNPAEHFTKGACCAGSR